MEKQIFLRAADVAELLEISKPKAYAVIHGLNEELKAKGYVTIAGRLSKQYFSEKFYGYDQVG